MNNSGSQQTLGVFAGLMVCLHVAAATTQPSNTNDSTISIQVGRHSRSFLLHAPPSASENQIQPLVIALHGAGSDGRAMRSLTGLNALADRGSFQVAYPDGLAGQHTWNALLGHVSDGQGVLSDDVDDVDFIRQLILTLRKTHHVDPRRVYVCGFSAGGYMAYRLALELPDLIAAAGVVNGSIGIKCADSQPTIDHVPDPRVPISLIHIRGAQDQAVKAEGGTTPKNRFLSATDCVAIFIKADQCKPAAKTAQNNDPGVTRSIYGGGKYGTEVEVVVVEHGGHEWPGRVNGFPTSEELWTFFKAHPRLGSQLDESITEKTQPLSSQARPAAAARGPDKTRPADFADQTTPPLRSRH